MSESINSIRYPMNVDAGLGELRTERDYEAHVEQMMKQVLFTSPGERWGRPDFGCGLRDMIFEPNGVVTADLMKVRILEALTTWLGSTLTVEDVVVEAEEAVMNVRIRYVLHARGERKFLNVSVEEARFGG